MKMWSIECPSWFNITYLIGKGAFFYGYLLIFHCDNRLTPVCIDILDNVMKQCKILQWRSLGLFSSEAIHRAERGEKMLRGSGN